MKSVASFTRGTSTTQHVKYVGWLMVRFEASSTHKKYGNSLNDEVATFGANNVGVL